MPDTAELYILTDRKAKILTLLKAALRKTPGGAADIVLFDDYVALLLENLPRQEMFARAAALSEAFDRHVICRGFSASGKISVGVCSGGRLRTFLLHGTDSGTDSETAAETNPEPDAQINMDYLSYIFNDKTVADLNRLAESGAEALRCGMEEDYGIPAHPLPVSEAARCVGWKKLEQGPGFAVYSAL